MGGRVFDVKVDGALAFRDLDVFAASGPTRVSCCPRAQCRTVRWTSGSSPAWTSVKGIEVITTGDDVPAWLAASPSTIDFPRPLSG